MQTDLNKQVDAFFEQHSISEINIENINTCFPDLQVENEYGNLLHAAVHHLYPEEKVLTFMKCLLEHGIDVNKQGKNTGYSFIHLALYGYTDEEEVDYSYSTEFIIQLIQLAIPYGFNVGIVDSDQDSIIHTALASEVYTGKTIDLIGVLGDNYDYTCKDDHNRNIYEALLNYREEAKREKNTVWYDRLNSEEQEMKWLVESSRFSLKETEKKLKELKEKSLILYQDIALEYLMNNFSFIAQFKKEIEHFLSLYHSLTSDQTEYDSLWNPLCTKIRKVLSESLKEVVTKPTFSKLNHLETICISLDLDEEKKLLQEIHQAYEGKISILKEKTAKISHLKELLELKAEIEKLEKSEEEKELCSTVDSRINKVSYLINEVQGLTSELIFLRKLIAPDEAIMEDQDLWTINEELLLQKKQSLQQQIEETKESCHQLLSDKLTELGTFIQMVQENDLLSDEEILSLFNEKVALKPYVLVKKNKPREW